MFNFDNCIHSHFLHFTFTLNGPFGNIKSRSPLKTTPLLLGGGGRGRQWKEREGLMDKNSFFAKLPMHRLGINS